MVCATKSKEENAMNNKEKELLNIISGLHKIPKGAYNVRLNGKLLSRNSTANIEIVSQKEKDGIDVHVQPNTKNTSVHIPVILSEGGLNDVVYNNFYIGENADVTIIAGCGIHNSTNKSSSHNGVHTFYLGENSKVKYIENHFAIGNGEIEKNLNPKTILKLGKNSTIEMETNQLGGVNNANRSTLATLADNATLIIKEKILTEENQKSQTTFKVELKGTNSKVEVLSRAVAKGESVQKFDSEVVGDNTCFGHVECDGILCDKAIIYSTPKIIAKNIDAVLIHEAAIGKISEQQQNKLMTLGLTKEEAEKAIIDGFLS